ncbi:hypothetical protein K1719_008408 [Acacia pycnantha]|nr:hypothetical protein K1719_008408 [Acacia pycnantha]
MGSRIVNVNIQEATNVVNDMLTYVPHLPPSSSMLNHSDFSVYIYFPFGHSVILNRFCSVPCIKIPSLASSDMNLSAAIVASQTVPLLKDTT